MFTLHNNGYNISKAIANLVPAGGPILCRDEMEEWSAGQLLYLFIYLFIYFIENLLVWGWQQ